MVDKEILFIFGAPRSGTKFINALLRSHFDYGLCSEGQWVLPFSRKLRKYGDLSCETNLTRLIDDIRKDRMFKIFQTVYSQRYGRQLDVLPGDIRRHMLEASYPGVVYAVFAAVAEQLDKSRVGNKYPDYWRELETLAGWFPNAKFLHVVRDGRDVALSTIKESWGGNSILTCARVWRTTMETSDVVGRKLSGRLLEIQYEHMFTNAQASIKKLEMFLGYELPVATRQVVIGELADSPFRHNFGKWKSRLSHRQMEVFEAIAGTWLSRYDYETRFSHPRISWSDVVSGFGHEVASKVRRTLLKRPSVNATLPPETHDDPDKPMVNQHYG